MTLGGEAEAADKASCGGYLQSLLECSWWKGPVAVTSTHQVVALMGG